MSKKNSQIERKFIYLFLLILLVTGTVNLFFLNLPMPATTTSKIEQIELNKRKKPRVRGISWADIWNLFKRDKRGGSRGPGEPCALAPLDSSLQEPRVKIWSLQPLFFWKSGTTKVGRVEVYDFKSNKLLFFKNVNATDSSVLYQGEALQPGNIYKFVILHSEKNGILWIPFQIMPDPERVQVAIELKTLEAGLNAKKASEETIAFHRAEYFAQRELWADVVQSAFTVENTSDELKEFIQQLPDLCQK